MTRKWLFVFVFLLMVATTFTINGKEDETFTEEELNYIKTHPVIQTAVDPEFTPYEFIDIDGEYKGIAADYLNLIAKRTGLRFEIRADLDWEEAYDKAIDGEIQLLPCIGKTIQREKLFLFTDSYLTYQRVLLSNVQTRSYSFSDLSKCRVGVQKNSSHYSFIIGETDIEPVLFKTSEELLLALSYNEIDVAITNYGSSRYLIKQSGIGNITIDDLYEEGFIELGMAISNNDEVLRSILDKGLKMITEQEKTQIQNDWLGIELAPDYSGIIRNLFIAAMVVLVIMGINFYWTYTLRREIKRRKILENELVTAKQEAEKANKAKSSFLANMSHEIRTPLNAITNIGYLLEKTSINVVQEKYISSLKDASNNLLTIINDILDFSKIEAGKMTIEEIPFNLEELLNRVSTLLMPKARTKNLSLHLIADVTIENELIGDATRIEQVLTNLVNNAIKFTDQGDITIEVHLVLDRKAFCEVRFSVKDTGIGISEDQMPHMFIPFHQLDSSITRRFGGTGLGLSICKNIITMLNGTIGVNSTYGQGSEFYFILPFKKQHKDSIATKKYQPDMSGIKAVVVEPDNTDREILCKYLEAFGVEVVILEDYNASQEAISNDVTLGIIAFDMNNKEAILLINKWIERGIHVVLIANEIIESVYMPLASRGVKDLLMKPVIPSALYNSIVESHFSKDEEMREEIAEEKKYKYNHIKILLVEDNEVNQMIESEILSLKGFQVVTAENGQVAVNYMKEKGDVDLILMDIHMPIMDGYEATKKIRQFNTMIPIIAMTAVSLSDVGRECEEAGMDGHVTKPVDPNNLFGVIDRFVADDMIKAEDSAASKEKVEMTIQERIVVFDKENMLDYAEGMRRIGNNESFYSSVLSKFYNELIGDLEQLTSEVEIEKIQEIVHKIKGMAGNIGAVKLYASSSAYIDILRSDEQRAEEEAKNKFDHDMKKTIAVIKEVL